MREVIGFMFTSLLATMCMAQTELSKEERRLRMEQRRLNDAVMLSTAIEMPLVSKSQILTAPLFQTNGTHHVNGFRIKTFNSPTDMPVNSCVGFDVYTNDQLIASGKLFERATFEDARMALIFALMNNNMPVEMLVDAYTVRINGIGDFSVFWKTRNAEGEILDEFSEIFFIRGAKAISVRGVNGTADVRPIAKTLDELLKHPPK